MRLASGMLVTVTVNVTRRRKHLKNSRNTRYGERPGVLRNQNLKVTQYVCRGRCGQWRTPEELTNVRHAQTILQNQTT